MRTPAKDRTYATLAIAIVTCVAVTFVHSRAENKGSVDIVTTAFRNLVIAPGSRVEQGMVGWNKAVLLSPFQARKLAKENNRLKARVVALTIENASLRQQASENDEMRRMLQLQAKSPWQLRAGSVVSLKPSNIRDNALVQFAGTKAAALRSVVIGPDGQLIGQVTQASGSVGDVLLISDTLSSVGARVVTVGRPPAKVSVLGICQGERGQLLSLVDMPADADVQPGDSVVTSGLGSVFPADIPIGTVTSVRIDAARALKSATVSALTDFNDIHGVFLRQ